MDEQERIQLSHVRPPHPLLPRWGEERVRGIRFQCENS